MCKQLPGERPFADEVKRMIRVNHAGEYGAKRIYAGQLAVLKKTHAGKVIEEMAQQEQVHLEGFERMIREHHVRPTLLMPLWHVAGFAMGAATALLGDKAAMACTVAVESVIDEHYAKQEEALAGHPEGYSQIQAMVTQYRADEKEHHDIAIEHGAEKSPFYAVLTNVIAAQTRLAIWLSTRL